MLTKIIALLKLIKFFIKNGKAFTSKFLNYYEKYGKHIISNKKVMIFKFNQRIVSFMEKERTACHNGIKISTSPNSILLNIGQFTFIVGVILALILTGIIYAIKLNQGIPFYKITSIFSIVITFIVIGAIITFPGDSSK